MSQWSFFVWPWSSPWVIPEITPAELQICWTLVCLKFWHLQFQWFIMISPYFPMFFINLNIYIIFNPLSRGISYPPLLDTANSEKSDSEQLIQDLVRDGPRGWAAGRASSASAWCPDVPSLPGEGSVTNRLHRDHQKDRTVGYLEMWTMY